MIDTISKRITSHNGQTLVELAIILPLLFILIFGIIEFGRYMYMKNSVTNAAREGARKAAVTKNPWSETTVRDYVISVSSLPLTTQNITIETIPAASPTNPSTNDAVIVTVRTRFSSVVPNLIPQFQNLTSIRASAAMRYE